MAVRPVHTERLEVLGAPTDAEAQQYLNNLYANITVQDDSARKSLETFTGGAGDVLLGYENEAIFAQQNGADIDYVLSLIHI